MFCRLRADPRKVRTAIGRAGRRWRATVHLRDSYLMVSRVRLDPARAMRAALRAADRAGFGGIDLDMQLAYEHPQITRITITGKARA